MSYFPIFLSVVIPLRNRAEHIVQIAAAAQKSVAHLVSDYEIIFVDNASTDDSVSEFKRVTGEMGQPNVQVYLLTKEVDTDTASWVGLENGLGDFIAVIDPMVDDFSFLPSMLDKAVSGADVVFASNEQKPKQKTSYRFANFVFQKLYKWFNGIHLSDEAPQFRILSKRLINFIQRHRQPSITYRHLPATGGFVRVNLKYSAVPKVIESKSLGSSFDRGIRMLLSTTRAPMRLVTYLSLFGAVANLLYSVYVVVVGFLKPDVAPGWISLSLQQSGMFFLISLVLLVLGEYILNMASLSNEGPLYHVGQEFTSSRMTRTEKLNIEEVNKSSGIPSRERR